MLYLWVLTGKHAFAFVADKSREVRNKQIEVARKRHHMAGKKIKRGESYGMRGNHPAM
jgi:hypothetical protein